jgi:hypothetical protein
VLKQIKDRVYKNRIRVKEFFADFDKLRCGSVTEAQVRAPLSLSHLLLRDATLQQLSVVNQLRATTDTLTLCVDGRAKQQHRWRSCWCRARASRRAASRARE